MKAKQFRPSGARIECVRMIVSTSRELRATAPTDRGKILAAVRVGEGCNERLIPDIRIINGRFRLAQCISRRELDELDFAPLLTRQTPPLERGAIRVDPL